MASKKRPGTRENFLPYVSLNIPFGKEMQTATIPPMPSSVPMLVALRFASSLAYNGNNVWNTPWPIMLTANVVRPKKKKVLFKKGLNRRGALSCLLLSRGLVVGGACGLLSLIKNKATASVAILVTPLNKKIDLISKNINSMPAMIGPATCPNR